MSLEMVLALLACVMNLQHLGYWGAQALNLNGVGGFLGPDIKTDFLGTGIRVLES